MNTDDIIIAICETCGVSVKSIYEHDTHKDVSTARNYIYYYLHYNNNMSYSQLSLKFNRGIRGIMSRIADMRFRLENDRLEKERYEKVVCSIYE